jgi:hypothetical protein
MLRFAFGVFVLLTACCPLLGGADPAEVIVEVRAGEHDREGWVASVELPPALRACRQLRLVRLDNGQATPVQVEEAGIPRACWCVREKLPAGKTLRYRLGPATDQPADSGGVSVTDDGKRLWVKVAGRNVLAYNHAVVPSPNPAEPYYAKSGYLHPVFSPSGQLVTDDFNPDHPHQHGIMFAWRKTTFEGRSTNGWDQKSQLGRVEHVRVVRFGGGPVFGFLSLGLRQVDLTAPGGPKPVLNLAFDVRVYNFADPFVVDLDATHTCASQSPVVIEQIEYGGLMFRGRAEWTRNHQHDYLTSEGKTKRNGDQSRPRWVQLYGPLEQRFLGLSVLDHPDNFRFPQPSRLAAETPYFCFAPASLGSFSIEPGKPNRARYRFLTHDGKLDSATLDRCWQAYAQPPTAVIVSP